MVNKRKVDFKILFNLLKSKGPIGVLGPIFIVISIFVTLFLIPFAIGFKGENQDYDTNAITKQGEKKDARITYIKTVHNVTINGEHPIIISYQYNDNGKKVTDKFETLDLEHAAKMGVDSVISVSVYQNESIINGLEGYAFPTRFLFAIPATFFLVGTLFLIIGLIPALKIYRLYQTGIVKEAWITSINYNNDFLSSNNRKTKLSVSYYFLNDLQQQVVGESTTNDYLLLQKKEGDKIKLFVSETDENRSCIIPTREAALYNWNI